MFVMYVDESGDTGLVGSPTRHFVLSGLVIHELRWHDCLERLIAFRKRMYLSFGLRLREEIHASRLINKPGHLATIRKSDRLSIVRFFIDELAAMPDISVINVIVDKVQKTEGFDVLEAAWRALIQRFDNTISHRNFPGPANPDERGMIFPDHTDDRKVKLLVRRMRRFNPVPNQPQFGPGYRNILLKRIIEDPSFRGSDDSYFIQAVDVIAYALMQHTAPSSFMRRKCGNNYFKRLAPILCTVASSTDPLGIVRL